MLPTGDAVKEVYLDQSSGVLAGVRAAATGSFTQKLIVECGTIESATILEVGKAAEATQSQLPSGSAFGTYPDIVMSNIPAFEIPRFKPSSTSTLQPVDLHSTDFVDAPVSGGPNGAANGTLAFMVGTNRPDPVFDQAKSFLTHMGKPDSIFLCGALGAGVAFKIINNYISAIASLASSEALNIGVKLGLDPKRLTEVINASGGQTWITSNINPVPGVQPNVPSSRNYEGGFRIELCKKVLEMGSELAMQANARTVLDKPTLAAFEEAAADERYKGKDARVVYKWLNEST